MTCLLGWIYKNTHKCRISSPVVIPLLGMSCAVSFQVICIFILFIKFFSRGQGYIVDSKGVCEEKRQIRIKSFHIGNDRIRFLFHKGYFAKVQIYPKPS